ncbi:MAG: hypothetical protein HY908_00095 [Myxococcales bacterium]|nr:hypothetical protein [Myxococcales bacterium]MCC6527190.1 hypothetical protein [Polyangiaceae bacterium]
MADEPKPKSPFEETRDALRRAKEQLAPTLKVASVVLRPAARAAKAVAWSARRAVQLEKLHDDVNKVLGIDPRHEVEVHGTVYRIAKVDAELFEARAVRADRVCGRFRCDADKRILRVESDDGEVRLVLDVAERAIEAGLAP